MTNCFGKLLILDCDDCKGIIDHKNYIQTFIDNLVEEMGMKKKGDTIFEYFEDNDYNRQRDIVGYSVVQIISLSNITIHINEISRTMYLDVFTCGDLNEEKVISLVNDYFKPTKIKNKVITRDAKL